MITEHNRAIRFFCLAFLQVLKSAQEGDKQKTLTMLESQISARLLQTTLFFKAKPADPRPADPSPTGSDAPSTNAAGSDSANSSTPAGNTEFLVLSDGQGHTALGAYTDRSSIPQDGGFYPEMPVYNIAYQLIQDDNQVGGIILNPGELNFFLDKNWLTRLVRFAQKIAEAKQQKDANQADSKQSKPSQADASKADTSQVDTSQVDASQAEPMHSDASQAEPEQK